MVEELTCTLADAPEARLPKLQVRVPLEMEHPETLGETDQVIPVPVGRTSDKVTLWAVPGPAFETEMVNPMGSPALTAAASAIFVIWRVGHCTVIAADACTAALLLACAVAVLSYVAQLAADVPEVTWTLAEAPAPRSPNEQVSVPDPMEHPTTEGETDQVIPGPEGSGSDKVTLVAVPVPLLVTRIVKPIGSPAETVVASAVLLMARFGHLTWMEAEALALPSLVVVTSAVLLTVPQLALVVGDVMWTCLLAPLPRVPKLQERTPLEIEQPVSDPPASIDHVIPALVGSVSETATPVADPVPLFVTVIRNPMGEPAETELASATLVIAMSEHATVAEAEAWTAELLVACAEA